MLGKSYEQDKNDKKDSECTKLVIADLGIRVQLRVFFFFFFCYFEEARNCLS